MNIQQIEDNVYISGQITLDDLAALAQSGIRTIICNRPDGEEEDQTDFATLQQAARQYGITMQHIPVVSSAITAAQVTEMAQTLQEAERPLLAYCRSGGRVKMLYRLATGQI